MKYILDTNIVSAYMKGKNRAVVHAIAKYRKDDLILSELVIYEIERGLKYTNAQNGLTQFGDDVIPMFNIVVPTLQDWRVASDLWVFTRRIGRQLSDVDLALAAITLRLGGILITNDQDFSAIPLLNIQDWTITI